MLSRMSRILSSSSPNPRWEPYLTGSCGDSPQDSGDGARLPSHPDSPAKRRNEKICERKTMREEELSCHAFSLINNYRFIKRKNVRVAVREDSFLSKNMVSVEFQK